MMNIDETEQRRAFAVWLRTGCLPTLGGDGVEFKFNPWHDPDDGQFTHAGAGRYFGQNGARSAGRHDEGGRKVVSVDKRIASPGTDTRKAEQSANQRNTPKYRTAIERRDKPLGTGLKPRSRGPLDKVAEFTGGVGEGLYDVGNETVTGLYGVVTTNPVTTVRNVGRGIAGTIDGAIAAEDTPAHVQVRRAAHVVANASAHDLGYATGRIAGNMALAAAPGAVTMKISAVRKVANAQPRAIFHPPKIVWPKESFMKSGAEQAKLYNDSAPGARPGHAPALTRTMPDGILRTVKFDGIDGDYLIDRKWSIRRNQKAKDQALRQSAVLFEHRLIAIWELPSESMRGEAIRFLNSLGIKNIKTRVVKP